MANPPNEVINISTHAMDMEAFETLNKKLDLVRLIVLGSGIFTLLLYLAVYINTGTWQHLITIFVTLPTPLLIYIGWQQQKKGNPRVTAYLFILQFMIQLPLYNLAWVSFAFILAGMTVVLPVILTAYLLERRDIYRVIIYSVITVILLFISDSLATWERIPILDDALLGSFSSVMPILLGLVFVWQAYLIYRNSRSLQVRLLFDFVGTALIAVAIIGGLSVFFSIQNATSDLGRQLQSITALKGNEVENWVSDLQNTFALALRPSELEAVQDILSGRDTPEQAHLEQDFIATITGSAQLQGLWLADLDGQLLLSAGRDIPTQLLGLPAYDIAREGNAYLQPLLLENNQTSLTISQPIQDEAGTIIAVLGGSADTASLVQLVGASVSGEGETTESYLIQQDGTLLTPVKFGEARVGQSLDTEIVNRIDDDSETGGYAGYYDTDVLGAVQWIPSLEVALVSEASESEAFGNVVGTIVSVVVAAAVAIGIGVLIGLYESRTLATPMQGLADVATQVAGGDLALRAEEPQLEEIAVVARSFNSMTGQLQELIGGLEERVAERTQVLETSFEVSRRISRIRDQRELVASVVEEVRSAFDYYYVQIYLLDEARDLLVVAGGTGKAGQILRDTEHSIQMGLGLVGRAAESNAYEIIPDVYENPNWLANEHLPDTKSEIAVPISIQDRVYGILDVQHDVQNGLSQTDADLLLSIANQVAIALESARLYERAQRKANQEALINNIVQEIQSTTSVERALQVAVRELGRAVRSPQTQIRLNVTDNGDNNQQQEGLYVGTD